LSIGNYTVWILMSNSWNLASIKHCFIWSLEWEHQTWASLQLVWACRHTIDDFVPEVFIPWSLVTMTTEAG